MTDLHKLLEKIDSMAQAEKKPTGPKFPGYWKGKDAAKLSHSRMVGSAQESVIKELHHLAKETHIKRKLENEFKNYIEEYGNAQDPNAQTTTPQSSAAQTQQQEKEDQDQRIDIASAKSLASSIKPALPPSIDTGTIASALTKINDQNSGKPAKPLTQPEQRAMGPVNALFARAAETPQTSTQLATILRNVNTLMKKGKA